MDSYGCPPLATENGNSTISLDTQGDTLKYPGAYWYDNRGNFVNAAHMAPINW